jgi:hypothetical protein
MYRENLARREFHVAAHGRLPTHHQRQTALGEVDHGGIEIGPLMECRHDHAAGKGSRNLRRDRGQHSGSSSGVGGSCDSFRELRCAKHAYPGVPREAHLHLWNCVDRLIKKKSRSCEGIGVRPRWP